jgi:glycine cleavage system aminomethyltransferase T
VSKAAEAEQALNTLSKSMNNLSVGEVRKSVIGTISTTIRKSIARASVNFTLADGTEAGDVLIENERLKTSVDIVNGRLKG